MFTFGTLGHWDSLYSLVVFKLKSSKYTINDLWPYFVYSCLILCALVEFLFIWGLLLNLILSLTCFVSQSKKNLINSVCTFECYLRFTFWGLFMNKAGYKFVRIILKCITSIFSSIVKSWFCTFNMAPSGVFLLFSQYLFSINPLIPNLFFHTHTKNKLLRNFQIFVVLINNCEQSIYSKII